MHPADTILQHSANSERKQNAGYSDIATKKVQIKNKCKILNDIDWDIGNTSLAI